MSKIIVIIGILCILFLSIRMFSDEKISQIERDSIAVLLLIVAVLGLIGIFKN